MHGMNTGLAHPHALLLAALALAWLPAAGRGEVIRPGGAYVLATWQSVSGPAVTTEYQDSGLVFHIRWEAPNWGYAVGTALTPEGYVPVWVGTDHWWHVPPQLVTEEPPHEWGLWADATSFSPIEASLTSPADSLRVSFLWGSTEGTATVTGTTRDGGSFAASAWGVGGATVSVDVPGVERFTASASGTLEYWGVSAIDVQFQAVPEPGGLALALLGGAGLLAWHGRRAEPQ